MALDFSTLAREAGSSPVCYVFVDLGPHELLPNLMACRSCAWV